jgi:hypothetical protein
MNNKQAKEILVSLAYARVTNSNRNLETLNQRARLTIEECATPSQKKDMKYLFEEDEYENKLSYILGIFSPV